MPILVKKMDTRRQTFFWAFQEYFDGGVSVRSIAIALQNSFRGEAPGIV